MNASNRSKVLVIGAVRVRAEPFSQRGLTLQRVKLEDLGDQLLNEARGIVLAEHPGKFRELARFFETVFQRACEFGLTSVVYSNKGDDSTQIIKLRDMAYSAIAPKQKLPAYSWAVIGEKVISIAENLARRHPGPELGSAIIETFNAETKLDTLTEVLMRRAFSDCNRIVVERLVGGKSGTDTYRVFASIGGPENGPQPMPFFVKVGDPEIICSEKDHYETRAEPFIPFHLRPSLNVARCVTAFPLAALVCNFVESAMPLKQALRAGHGGGTIFSLFEVTLRGLRSHTARAPKEAGVIARFLTERVKTTEIGRLPEGPARLDLARRLGLKRNPEELEQALQCHAARIETRCGTYHGDLHFGNVMVRNRDAIVIDFGSMQDFGPITADPAILEVSLVFGTDERDDPSLFETWRSLVDELFIHRSAIRPPIHNAEHGPFSWLLKAIRELRHIGSCCDIDPAEARIVLAGCLLRFARLSKFESSDDALVELSEKRRAYALVMAESISAELNRTDATG